uniref:IMP dehydrogenase n=1 Tax=Paenibacillus sinopodophylli TaxID=1837342 RepID=UPI001FE90A3E
GLVEGDVVNVYKAATGGTAIGTATVGTGATTATVTIEQLGAAAGSVYVSVKKAGQLESTRTVKAYETEITAPVAAANIVVLNNDGDPDIVRVTGLVAGDVVNVYTVATNGSVVGTATVGDGKTSVNVSITQLSVAAGKVYVTITKDGKQESTRVAKDYIAE